MYVQVDKKKERKKRTDGQIVPLNLDSKQWEVV